MDEIDELYESLPPSEEWTDDEEGAIWEEFIATRSRDLRDRLVKQYTVLVYQTAQRIASKLPNFVSIDDLIGWGNLGLLDAINRYETNRNTKFSTYCSTRISGHIIDELRRLDWTPRLVRTRAAQLERARDELRSILGREPDDDEIMKELGVKPHEYLAMVKETQPRSVVSLNRKHDEDDTNEIGKIELLPDRNAVDPVLELQRREIKEVVLRGLNSDQKKVLTMYYYDELNMKEIGDLLGLSESRVCQIHKQVMDLLRSTKKERDLTPA
ncbi:DNA-directed RNA polymerase sigma-70 factor [Planctomycetales bacterium]|jgi:RNA polymerase sigma factor for flagellar operon FliA|nr:FliA/WhiG family RNA polymerase sigma factor [Planctomycetota bacterium]GHS90439.1 DNA-directed RNA polymerase sigma-70 factor [Planctomycetales bacterium]GHT02291.1 DNA-directed RNA polymerase sigma-70 factor [Planctomycetales bacterium]GHV18991.1 DNA-directed RNA polymerase sigma-70 factor [Planctomycetales bacterium]